MTIYLPGTELTVKSFQVRISDNYLPGTVKSLQVRISDNYLPGTVKSLHLTICPPVSTVRMFCTSMRRKPLFSNFHLFFIQSFFASRFTYLAQSNQILFGALDLAIQIHVGVQCPIYLPGTDAPPVQQYQLLTWHRSTSPVPLFWVSSDAILRPKGQFLVSTS